MLETTGYLSCRVSQDGSVAAGKQVHERYDTNLCDGKWHHAAMVWDDAANMITVYVDGSMVPTTQVRTGATGVYQSNIGMQLGCMYNSGAATLWFGGRIAGATFWSTTLTSGEVSEWWNYGARFRPAGHSQSANCVLFLPLGYGSDDPTDTTGGLKDISGNGHDADPVSMLASALVDDGPEPLYADTNGVRGGGYAFTPNVGERPITVPDSAPVQDIFSGATGGTVCAWINATSRGELNAGRIVQKSDPGVAALWNFRFEPTVDNGLRFVRGRATTPASWLTTAPGSVPYGMYTHIAVTYKDGDVAPIFYVNGTAVNVTTVNAGAGAFLSDVGHPLTMGDTENLGVHLDCTLDGVQIYSTILSPQNISRVRLGLHPIANTDFS